MLSDEKASSDRIEQFTEGDDRWMVAVRMVSEGVDVPRLSVGVYATSASTPLYFAQAIGRFVRARRRGELASIFLPSVPPLLGLATELERERDHALDREQGDDQLLDDELLERAEQQDAASAELLDEYEWTALGSVATFEKVLFDGEEYGTLAEPGSPEEWDFIGIPGILEPERGVAAAAVTAGAAATARGRATAGARTGDSSPQALHRTLVRAAQAAERAGVDPRALDGSDARPGARRGAAALRRARGVAGDGHAAAGAHRPAAPPHRRALRR